MALSRAAGDAPCSAAAAPKLKGVELMRLPLRRTGEGLSTRGLFRPPAEAPHASRVGSRVRFVRGASKTGRSSRVASSCACSWRRTASASAWLTRACGSVTSHASRRLRPLASGMARSSGGAPGPSHQHAAKAAPRPYLPRAGPRAAVAGGHVEKPSTARARASSCAWLVRASTHSVRRSNPAASSLATSAPALRGPESSGKLSKLTRPFGHAFCSA
mmetsp:Transcript_56380/g.127912  ORF Transcript_56380/g.127912 Transcript_56380/m.127912 type:complete len:217 (-) Transcript_56380:1873-2523(-)